MDANQEPYYRAALATVHDLGFGGHADACAPGILELLEPLRRSGGVVLELGCGSGRLTRHLLDAGLDVIATDASPAMLELARDNLGGTADLRPLVLPDDPLPRADAIVSVGHVLNYLPDEAAVHRALTSMAGALLPGGVLAFDVCDLRWGQIRGSEPPFARVEDDWAIVTRYSLPRPELFARDITAFVRDPAGTWHRDDEHHGNVLLDTATIPELLRPLAVEATIAPTLGAHELPDGLIAIVGRRRSAL